VRGGRESLKSPTPPGPCFSCWRITTLPSSTLFHTLPHSSCLPLLLAHTSLQDAVQPGVCAPLAPAKAGPPLRARDAGTASCTASALQRQVA